jgi:hypothetical protein
MARPSETEHQEPGPSTKTTSEKIPEQTARRELYLAGNPDSAPELVQFIKYATETDIDQIETKDLLITAKQASLTIADWEIAMVTQDAQIIHQQEQIEAL